MLYLSVKHSEALPDPEISIDEGSDVDEPMESVVPGSTLRAPLGPQVASGIQEPLPSPGPYSHPTSPPLHSHLSTKPVAPKADTKNRMPVRARHRVETLENAVFEPDEEARCKRYKASIDTITHKCLLNQKELGGRFFLVAYHPDFDPIDGELDGSVHVSESFTTTSTTINGERLSSPDGSQTPSSAEHTYEQVSAAALANIKAIALQEQTAAANQRISHRREKWEAEMEDMRVLCEEKQALLDEK
ncbi:hypothetical protein IAT38_003851 [Cryptococcus sp. DSM 104549]